MGQLNPINKSYCLQTLCEENFVRLLQLAPTLSHLEKAANQSLFNGNTLHITQLDKSPYTTSCTLTVRDAENHAISPDIKCRIYFDTKSVDVLSIEGLSPVFEHKNTLNPKQVMDNKWALNYFLDKWLSFFLNKSILTQEIQDTVNA
jgi:hypothetical protein